MPRFFKFRLKRGGTKFRGESLYSEGYPLPNPTANSVGKRKGEI